MTILLDNTDRKHFIFTELLASAVLGTHLYYSISPEK